MAARSQIRRVAAGVGVAFLALVLVGCAGGAEPERPTEAPTTTTSTRPSPSATPTATATPTPTPPRLRPDGTAEDNLPFFDQTIADYVGAYGRGERAILVGART